MPKSAIPLLTAILLLASCSDSDDMPTVDPIAENEVVSPSVIEEEAIDTMFCTNVTLHDTLLVYEESKTTTHHMTIPGCQADKAIDIHLNILPVYVFGEQDYSGDYYAVSGYVVSHNSKLYKEALLKSSDKGDIYSSAKMYGWYMGNLKLEFQLLDDKGNTVDNENVTFHSTPEPSTTISETTYNSGYDFTMNYSYTLGCAKIENREKKLEWRNTTLGTIGTSFRLINSHSQYLPDQGVVMSTNPFDRAVDYTFVTNNAEKAFGTEGIPHLFRADQRVDFGWIWHVRKGAYNALDNNFNGMQIAVTITPQFQANIDGRFMKDEHNVAHYIQEFGWKATKVQYTYRLDIPTLNRIPTGTVELLNTTRNYVTDITIYRSGEFHSGNSAYCTLKGSFGNNQTAQQLLRVGTYDIIYTLVNGNSGSTLGRYKLTDISITPAATTHTSTMDATRLLH